MTTHTVTATIEVQVVINDNDVIARCVENQNGDGVPQARDLRGTGWLDNFYELDSDERVIEHLAYNAAANGLTDLRRLDGWADLPDDAAEMRVIDVYGYMHSEPNS